MSFYAGYYTTQSFVRTAEKILYFDFLSLEPLHKNTLKSTENALKKPWKYLEKPMFILLGTLNYSHTFKPNEQLWYNNVNPLVEDCRLESSGSVRRSSSHISSKNFFFLPLRFSLKTCSVPHVFATSIADCFASS